MQPNILKPDMSKLIDHRNRELWEYLNSHRKIDIQYTLENSYIIFSKSNEHIIGVPHGNYSVESFTHELLHIDLDVHGIAISSRINSKFVLTSALQGFTSELGPSIGNYFDHIKMLPKFLEMGFEKERFIQDYFDPKFDDTRLSILRQLLQQEHLRTQGYESIIGNFFAMKSCPNNNFDYSLYLQNFKSLAPELYQIINNFWNSWHAFDISRIQSIMYDYNEFTNEFFDQLEEFMESNIN